MDLLDGFDREYKALEKRAREGLKRGVKELHEETDLFNTTLLRKDEKGLLAILSRKDSDYCDLELELDGEGKLKYVALTLTGTEENVRRIVGNALEGYGMNVPWTHANVALENSGSRRPVSEELVKGSGLLEKTIGRLRIRKGTLGNEKTGEEPMWTIYLSLPYEGANFSREASKLMKALHISAVNYRESFGPTLDL